MFDYGLSLAVTTIVLVGWIFGVAYAYKKRNRIKRWLNEEMAYDEIPPEVRLRRRIEDAQRGLEILAKDQPKEGG